MPKFRPIEERFFEKIELIPFHSCWEWTGGKFNHGYGMFRMSHSNERDRLAHRASWIIHFGPIPEGMDLLHSCDNRGCVNPHHLRLGTHDDNMKDMAKKHRGTCGTKSAWSKLSEEDVRTVRKLYAEGWKPKTLAERFPVSKQVLWQIVTRRKWKHI